MYILYLICITFGFNIIATVNSNETTEDVYASGTSWIFDADDVDELKNNNNINTDGDSDNNNTTNTANNSNNNNNNNRLSQSGIFRKQYRNTSNESAGNMLIGFSNNNDSYKVTVQDVGSNDNLGSNSMTFNRNTSSGIQQIKQSNSQSQLNYRLQANTSTTNSSITNTNNTNTNSTNNTSSSTSIGLSTVQENKTVGGGEQVPISLPTTVTTPKIQPIIPKSKDHLKVPEIDDFFNDFEKEIVLPEATTLAAVISSTSSSSSASVSRKSSEIINQISSHDHINNNNNNISSSNINKLNENIQIVSSEGNNNTDTFMDELEDIIDGKG